MLLKCSGCGYESEIEQAFRKYKPRRSKRTPLLCPECWRKKTEENFKVGIGLIAFAFVGGVVSHYLYPSNVVLPPFLLNLVLIYIFMQATIIPHELGHAIMGKLFGLTVFMVSIGYGKVLLTGKSLGLRWELRPFPIGGVTVAASRSLHFFRLRRFFMVLGGPLVNIIFIILAYRLAPPATPRGVLDSWGIAPFFDFIAANALVLVNNLFPRKITTDGRGIITDGLALLTTPFIPQKAVEEHRVVYFFLAAQELFWQKQYTQAARECEEGLVLYPDAVPLRILYGNVLLAMNEVERARGSFIDTLQLANITADVKMTLLNNVAYVNLLTGRGDLLEEADRYSEEAYRNAPWVPAFKSTRGAVLVEAGRVEKGLVLLRDAFDKQTEVEGKALTAAHIALGEKRLGNIKEAVHYFNVSRVLDPNCQLLVRMNKELGL